MEEIFSTTTPPLKGRVKQRYSDFIVEEVTPEGTCTVQRYNRPLEERNFDPFKVPENPEQKEHLILDMEKVNIDTSAALAIISRGLNVGKTRIGYGGLKDKRAITAQRISIYQPDSTRMERFGVKGIELRNPRWGERLELGDLLGNQFTLTIRNISETPAEIESIISQFAKAIETGVPNYFGNQRFGGKRQITHRVGKLLLKKQHKEAIMLYLTETYEEEKVELKNARINLAKTGDFAKALREFPRDARTELALLNHLVKFPADFANAFSSLPKKMRYLFTHAYQSYLFNLMLTERLKLLGASALLAQEGDILEAGEPTAMLAGYESTFAAGIQGEIERRILSQEGITLEEFKVAGISELSSQGARKSIVLHPQKFALKNIFEDDQNEGKRAVTIEFFLSKGNYATTVLRELLKEEIY